MRQIRRTSAKRKLLSPAVLANVELRAKMRVPITVIVKQLNLSITRQHLATLLKWYHQWQNETSAMNKMAIHDSLFPAWLDSKCMDVQTNPDHWVYIDRFPLGYWDYNADNKAVH